MCYVLFSWKFLFEHNYSVFLKINLRKNGPHLINSIEKEWQFVGNGKRLHNSCKTVRGDDVATKDIAIKESEWWVITTYCTDLDVNLQDTDEENQNSSETISSIEWCFCNMLTPSEGHGPRPIRSLLDQRLVELSARATVNRGPALLAIILK